MEQTMLRCVGGPYDGQYFTPGGEILLAGDQPTWSSEQDAANMSEVTNVAVRHYHRFPMGWDFNGMHFERELLLWDNLEPGDALIILMRRFVGLLDEQSL